MATEVCNEMLVPRGMDNIRQSDPDWQDMVTTSYQNSAHKYQDCKTRISKALTLSSRTYQLVSSLSFPNMEEVWPGEVFQSNAQSKICKNFSFSGQVVWVKECLI